MVRTSSLLSLLLVALVCGAATAEIHTLRAGVAGTLAVNVNTTSGECTVVVDGQTWFNSGPIGLFYGGKWYRTSDFKLTPVIKNTTGTDNKFGAYNSLSIQWPFDQAGAVPFTTTVKVFTKNLQLVLFTQTFPKGNTMPSNANNSMDVVASFPTFSNSPAKLYYLTYANTFATPKIGTFNYTSTNFPGGVTGGSPLVFYNNNLRTLMFSPFDNFMVGAQTLSSSLKNNLAFGLNGKIENIPQGYEYTTVLLAGQGVTETFLLWGDVMMQQYNKARVKVEDDLTISKLGYWTDNGAYYYYVTEPNKTYEQTMIDVGAYIKEIALPVQYYQLDSWWYFKGPTGGVSIWEPMDTIFPDGMGYVHDKLDAPFSLHNRWFDPASPYTKNYTMIVEKQIALPADEALFDHIMGKTKAWGMVTYEQDWLVTTYTEMQATQNNVSNSRNWLLDMGKAATKLDVTIQYCMALPNHILQSVEVQPVTQIRVSDDYNPSNSQWQIFHTSLFVWSLGAFPFKDDFWTTTQPQPGCKTSFEHGCTEFNPELETLVAALSAGPVGPSDMIGKLDKNLVMRTARQSGDLLKADVPAFPLDSTFLPQPNGNPALIQVASSYTAFGLHRWYYLLGAQLASAYVVNESDLPNIGASAKVFDYFAFLNGTTTLSDFNAQSPLKIPAGSSPNPPNKLYVPFNYYVVAPVLPCGWVLLGETSKFITVSRQRITSFQTDADSLLFTAVGSKGEKVTFSLLNTASKPAYVQSFTYTYTANGEAQLICNSGATGTCKFA